VLGKASRSGDILVGQMPAVSLIGSDSDEKSPKNGSVCGHVILTFEILLSTMNLSRNSMIAVDAMCEWRIKLGELSLL
jgi:hypothetical protein